jgi:hypothetical protein
MKTQDPDFSGMTASERLFALGLLEEYNRAVQYRDLRKIRTLLARIRVEDGAIETAIRNLDK